MFVELFEERYQSQTNNFKVFSNDLIVEALKKLMK